MNYLVVEFTFIKEKIAVSGNDGWLARDLDGDGEIDGVSELFGESGDGFADLALLDTNADGKIDAQDAAYDELLVWQDANEDGITQDGELLSVVNDLFIRERPVAPIDGTLENVTEAAIGQLHIEDIFLNTDNRNAISAEDIPLDFDVIGLPELRGYGRVNNLSQEMSLSTVLKADVQNLAAWSLEQIFTDFADFRDDFNTVLYKWTGVNDIAIDSRGPNLDDARKLELLEEFDDREFLQFGNVQNSSNDNFFIANDNFTTIRGNVFEEVHYATPCFL